jgi:hypothetical protein
VQSQLDLIRHCMDALDNVIDWDKLTSNEGLMRAFRLSSGPK